MDGRCHHLRCHHLSRGSFGRVGNVKNEHYWRGNYGIDVMKMGMYRKLLITNYRQMHWHHLEMASEDFCER